jgi:hypothetical protein
MGKVLFLCVTVGVQEPELRVILFINKPASTVQLEEQRRYGYLYVKINSLRVEGLLVI